MMKAIQLFFELLIQYQRAKAEIKMYLEHHRLECKIAYEERMKELHQDAQARTFTP